MAMSKTHFRTLLAGLALAGLCNLTACTQPQETEATLPNLSGDMLIEHVKLIDFSGEQATSTDSASVLITDGKIAYAGDGAMALNAEMVIDGTGLTLTPGLTDMHVHVWDEAELGAYLAHGVTTVRNMSGMPFHLDLMARIDAGTLTGPRLLTSGPILNSTGPNMQINHQLVEDAEAARAAVRWQHDAGFRRLKVYSNLTQAAYEAILDEAEQLDMAITGHTPEGKRGPGIPLEKPFVIAFEDILDDGFETIEHIESIVWHGLRYVHDEDRARELAGKIRDADVAVTPTLLAHHNLLRVASEGEAVLSRPGTQWLNPFEQSTEQASHAQWLASPTGQVSRDDAFYGRVAKIFDEEGVLMVAGSDAGIFTNIPGLSLLEEMDLLVAAGMSPYRALRTATYNPSVVLGEPDRGCLNEGCIADLVLYACDPLADTACLREVTGVIRAGEMYDRAALDAMLEAAANTDAERTQTNLFAGLEAQGTSLDALGQ